MPASPPCAQACTLGHLQSGGMGPPVERRAAWLWSNQECEMPEVTQEMMAFANFMETYVEPAMAFAFHFVYAFIAVFQFVSDVVALMLG